MSKPLEHRCPRRARLLRDALVPLAVCFLLVAFGSPTLAGSSQGEAATASPDGGLRRRGRVGLLFSEGPSGLVVREVVRNSPASASGFRVGDVVTSVDGTPVRDRWTLLSKVRVLRAGDTLRLGIVRDGAAAEVALEAGELEREGDLNASAEYLAFDGKNGRLRSVWSIPAKASTTTRPAVLVIRGVGAPAADAPGNNTFRELAFYLAAQGTIVVRYDAEGVGDSEGGAAEAVDFNTEVADARAALAHLRADARVDPARVVVLGQGTGGGVAAVVAEQDKVAGLVVVGTIARPLMEYATESRRAQLALARVTPDEMDTYVRDHIAVFSQLAIGGDLAPGTNNIVTAEGTLLGKRPEFWRQYDNAAIARVFARLDVPVMNVIGEFDFVSCLGEHRAIADALRVKNATGQVLVVLDRTDHDLREYDSREAAWAGIDSSSASANQSAFERIAEWVRTTVSASSQQ